ncbi:MAG: isoprenylcysteine carboxylmethyltransferase family protein [Lentisphaeria bacterium]
MDTPKSDDAPVGKWLGITLFTALCLFGAAGTIRWWNAWVFIAANTVTAAILTNRVFKASPDLVQERATARRQAKAWDKVLVPFVVAVFPLASLILAGLDRRYGWTHAITTAESVTAIGILLAANGLVFWAMKSNRFFSSHVRIQTDRGHTAVDRGPYAWIRHPGYAGMILHGLAAPVLLGSAAALWAGVANAGLLVLRTVLEDRTLLAELPGYREYAERVRHRLVPWVW